MAIRLLVAMQDDAPVPPFTRVNAESMLSTDGLKLLVNGSGRVDRIALQSYLTLMAEPLANDYETRISAPEAESTFMQDVPDALVQLTEGLQEPDVFVEPPRLELTTANYFYRKPISGIPAQGEILHPTSAIDTLQVSIMDADVVDRTAVLELLLSGDTITIDSMVWTVIGSSYNATQKFFDYYITPATPSGITDSVTPVTFTPTPPEPPTPEPGPEPLPTTTLNYEYVRAAVEDNIIPSPGTIVHSDLAIDGLRISFTDHDGNDQTELLNLLIPGDTISLDSMVWDIHITTQTAEWIDVYISPASPNATAGIFAVTFQRPLLRRRY